MYITHFMKSAVDESVYYVDDTQCMYIAHIQHTVGIYTNTVRSRNTHDITIQHTVCVILSEFLSP